MFIFKSCGILEIASGNNLAHYLVISVLQILQLVDFELFTKKRWYKASWVLSNAMTNITVYDWAILYSLQLKAMLSKHNECNAYLIGLWNETKP